MVNVEFLEGENSAVICGLTQWDKGQVLQITDTTLPAAFEVHFAPRGGKTAHVVEATAAEGAATVDIPDEVLQQNKDVLAYVYVDGETVKTIVMPVTARPKPEDYVYTPTERLSYANLEKRIAALEAMAETDIQGNYTFSTIDAAGLADTHITDHFNVQDCPHNVTNLRIENGNVLFDIDTSGVYVFDSTGNLADYSAMNIDESKTLTGELAIWWAVTFTKQ